MGKGYLIDTNVLIDFQIGSIPPNGLKYVIDIINDSFTISVVTYIECLGYKDVSQTMEEFVAIAEVIKLTDAIIDKTIALRKIHKIKLPDAIIAATTIVNQLTLVSHNAKDFQKIEGLQLIDPYHM